MELITDISPRVLLESLGKSLIQIEIIADIDTYKLRHYLDYQLTQCSNLELDI